MNNDILSSFRPAIVMTALFALLLGVIYPLALTGIGQAVFPHQANGSLIEEGSIKGGGKLIGSELLAQGFTADRYFHPRPSAAGKGYDGLSSAGSNLGPASQALHDRIAADVKALKTSVPDRSVPLDMVTASASGLDPDITPEAAFYQLPRVAKARGLSEAALTTIVTNATQHPLLGFLGENRVNVLLLNRQLDSMSATKGR
jgi:K+-transporting ATPase ATPase C chain